MKRPAEPLSESEVKKLIAACNTKYSRGARNAAILSVLYRCGLRCQECCDLELRDLDVEHETLRVRHGKGDHCRVVGIDSGTIGIITQWLKFRGHEPGPLFITNRLKSICTSYIRSFMTRLGRKCGISKRVHPHGLRHTLAFELAQEGVPIHVIQQVLGHDNVATTDRYIRHLHPRAAVDAMRTRQLQLA